MEELPPAPASEASFGIAMLASSMQRLHIRRKITKMIQRTSKLPMLLVDGRQVPDQYTSSPAASSSTSVISEASASSVRIPIPSAAKGSSMRNARSLATTAALANWMEPSSLSLPTLTSTTRTRSRESLYSTGHISADLSADNSSSLGAAGAESLYGESSISAPAQAVCLGGSASPGPWSSKPIPEIKVSSSNFTNDFCAVSDSESGVAFLDEGFCKDGYDPLLTLPSEIVDLIFSKLDIATLSFCSLVSRAWYAKINTNATWRAQFRSNPHWRARDNVPSHISWKSLYITRHELEKRWVSGSVQPRSLLGHTDRVYCVYFDDDKIVTGSSDWTIKVWDYKTGNLLRSLGRWKGEYDLDDFLQTASDTSTDSRNGVLIPGPVSANTTRRASHRNNAQTSETLFHEGSILCLYFDSNIMVTGSSDNSCIIWELPTFKPVKRLYRHTAGVLDVCLDENHIAACSKDGSISVWDRHDPEYTMKVRLVGHRGPVNALKIQGDFVVSAGGDALVKLWSISEGRCIRDFRGHTRGLACISFSSDAKKIVSGGNDNAIRIWDTESGECLHVLTGHKSLVRSLHVHSGKIISGSYDQVIKIWDLESGQLITDLAGYHGSWIFSTRADCRRIISTSIGINPVILDFSYDLDDKLLSYLEA